MTTPTQEPREGYVWVVCSDKKCPFWKRFLWFRWGEHHHEAPAVLKMNVTETVKTEDRFGRA